MSPEEAVLTVLETGEEVKFQADLLTFNEQRKALHQAALKLSAVPIIIFTRTENGFPYFIVRQYDKNESVPFRNVEQEVKQKGWI